MQVVEGNIVTLPEEWSNGRPKIGVQSRGWGEGEWELLSELVGGEKEVAWVSTPGGRWNKEHDRMMCKED